MVLEEKIENLIKPIIEESGYKLVEIKLRPQGQQLVLTITINKEGGVSVEDCAKVSRLIEPVLDEKDLIKRKYLLVISSPGIE